MIQTENDYNRDVFNGDLGMIEKINRIEQEMVVNFEGRQVEYDFGDLDELALAYVLSIHKSQGSEFPCVVIPLHTQHYMMLQRNLLYTAVTRGKKLVVLVGTKKALGMAVRRQDTSRRYTALRKRLQGDLKPEADDEELAVPTECSHCGSTRIIPGVNIVDQGEGSDGKLEAVIYGSPQALIFKDRLYGEINADICGECGHIELRVTNPRELYEHYRKSRGLPQRADEDSGAGL